MDQQRNEYTESGLPVLSRDVAEVFFRDLTKRYEERPVATQRVQDEQRSVLHGENPILDQLISEYVELLDDEQARGFLAGAVVTYEVLRRQGELGILEQD